MRLSRNRNWGHPRLIETLEKLAHKVPKISKWHGLLVGDISQPRGGPMLTGHSSHQIGLDADIWLTPMPDRMLSRNEREDMSATNVVAADKRDVDPARWTPSHGAVIRAAAEIADVERIFVNAAIKKALCREAKGDRSWLRKVRRYAIPVIFVIAAIITPPDVVSQFMVAVPMIGLYELSILISSVIYKKKQKEDDADDDEDEEDEYDDDEEDDDE